MNIGERLKEWRAYKKLTQKNVGELLGISSGVYQKYEMELRAPGAEAMEAFYRAGININWLLSGEGPMLLDDSYREVPPSAYLDIEALETAIEWLDELLVKDRCTMTPEDKAQVIRLAYEIFIDEDEEEDEVSYRHAQKFLKKFIKSKEIS